MVRVNGKIAKKGDFAVPGDTISLRQEPPNDSDLSPCPGDPTLVSFLYEDPVLVAVDKPAGIASHPIRPEEMDTAANAIVRIYPECQTIGSDPREAGLVHRLDIGTSGVLIAARNTQVWQQMRDYFGCGKVTKTYLALVVGCAHDGHSTKPLVHAGKRMRIATSAHSRALSAQTTWRVVKRFQHHTLVECTAHTGRMHQVRVHLAHAGHPVFGDAQYGQPVPSFSGHFLHAHKVRFVHPVDNTELEISAPLSKQSEHLLTQL